MTLSPYRKRKIQYAAVLGGIVGLALFAFCWAAVHSFVYLLFIFFGAAIAAATVWVRDSNQEE
ncbi:MAG: hypothetical protein WCQ63_01575 [Methanomethylophilus sp.]|nr:hypothetical protein [Methanomethylophilus sp.]MDD4221835.1 hypothetical protein [Methanomethylophilus sp.]MDD4668311.1 hypothetical protein [Methanomethylophilus sp.]